MFFSGLLIYIHSENKQVGYVANLFYEKDMPFGKIAMLQIICIILLFSDLLVGKVWNDLYTSS